MSYTILSPSTPVNEAFDQLNTTVSKADTAVQPTGTSFTGAIHSPTPVSLTSVSGVLTLTEESNSFVANGSEAITSIAGWTSGTVFIRWNTVRTLTYNATSLILKNLTNRMTAIGDVGIYEVTSAGVREIDYSPAITTTISPTIQGLSKNLKITNNTVSFTGTTTSGSSVITGISSTTGITVGMVVSGTGIASGSTVISISSTTITLSLNTTASATTALTADHNGNSTDITTDQIILFNSANSSYLATNVSLTANISNSGVNGLDTGAKANSTFYSVWIIYNGTTIASLLSLSDVSPNMPSGYTYKARVGWIKTNSSGTLYKMLTVGNTTRYIVDGTTLPAFIAMASGISGNVDTPIWTPLSTSGYIPSTARKISILANKNTNANSLLIASNANQGSYNSSTNPPIASLTGTTQGNVCYDIFLESTNIYWASTGSSFTIRCIGWED